MKTNVFRLLTENDTQHFGQIAKQHALIGAMFGSGYSPTSEDTGKLISYIWANKKEKILDIYSLWTAENYRGQGLATQLKNEMEKWAVDHGVNRVDTTINAENKKMLELNQKLGYEVKYFRMEKNLRS